MRKVEPLHAGRKEFSRRRSTPSLTLILTPSLLHTPLYPFFTPSKHVPYRDLFAVSEVSIPVDILA